MLNNVYNAFNKYPKRSAIIQEENEGRASYREIGIINKYGAEDERVNLNMDFFGLDLGKVPTQNLGDWTVYIIPVLYVSFSFKNKFFRHSLFPPYVGNIY